MATRLALASSVRSRTAQQLSARSLISAGRLRQCLGALWLLDGLLQLFPSMWTSALITNIMEPATAGQPTLIANTLQPIITLSSHHILIVNALIAVIQILLGVCLLSGRFVRASLLASVAWSFGVWYGGEGLGMLLTGQASGLTGALGAVVFYAILAALAYPTDALTTRAPHYARSVLIGLWGLTAALQLQPYWWKDSQISRSIAANAGDGTLSGMILGPSIRWMAGVTSGREIILNVIVIGVALTLAVGILITPKERSRPLLLASVAVSALVWWATQGFGSVLTGSATDVNSGALVILLALICWPRLQTNPGAKMVGSPRV